MNGCDCDGRGHCYGECECECATNRSRGRVSAIGVVLIYPFTCARMDVIWRVSLSSLAVLPTHAAEARGRLGSWGWAEGHDTQLERRAQQRERERWQRKRVQRYIQARARAGS